MVTSHVFSKPPTPVWPWDGSAPDIHSPLQPAPDLMVRGFRELICLKTERLPMWGIQIQVWVMLWLWKCEGQRGDDGGLRHPRLVAVVGQDGDTKSERTCSFQPQSHVADCPVGYERAMINIANNLT